MSIWPPSFYCRVLEHARGKSQKVFMSKDIAHTWGLSCLWETWWVYVPQLSQGKWACSSWGTEVKSGQSVIDLSFASQLLPHFESTTSHQHVYACMCVYRQRGWLIEHFSKTLISESQKQTLLISLYHTPHLIVLFTYCMQNQIYRGDIFQLWPR